LKFWDEEINSFTKRLEEVVERYNDNEIRAKIEHFQNRFLLNHQAINKQIKEVNKHEKILARYAEHHMSTLENTPVHDHASLRELMQVQRAMYAELKSEYYSFLTKNI